MASLALIPVPELVSKLEFWGLMLLAATALVVIGLIIEYWHDVKEFWVMYRWPMASFPWEKFWSLFGGILVTVGVSLELIFTYMASRAENNLRTSLEQEAIASQQDLRRSMNMAFQQTGNRTIDPFMFLHVLEGKPTGNVVLWVEVDGGEPHQYAWQIWHTLNRSPGWSAKIKRWEDKPPSTLQPAMSTGIYLRCRTGPQGDWLRNPKTACEALLDAVMQGTNGRPFSVPADSDPTLNENEFVIEVYTQPKQLAAPPTKQQTTAPSTNEPKH